MSDGRPPLFDDGGHTSATERRNTGRAGPTGPDESPEPDYLRRRIIAVAGVVVVVAISAIVIGRAIGEGGGGRASTDVDDGWNSVVVLDEREIRVLDPSSGEVVDTIAAEDDLLDVQSVVSGSMLVTMTDEGKIVQTDLTDGTTRRSRSEPEATLLLSRANPEIAIAGPGTGGEITIVDTRRQGSFRIGDVAGLDEPLMFPANVLVNPSGSHLAVSDARTFQTVVVDIVEETAALIAGQAIAIDDETVVTAQRAGDETEVEFYDLLGERTGRADVATPNAVLLTPDHDLLLVDGAGAVSRVTSGGDVDAVGELTHPDGLPIEVRQGEPTRDNTRLVATSTVGTFVIDESGDQLAHTTGESTPTIRLSNECLVVNASRAAVATVQLDLDDGSTTADVEEGFAAFTSLDGCTSVIQGVEPPQLLRDDEVSPIDADSVTALAPDGGAVVALSGTRHQLVRSADEDPVDLATGTVIIHFANR